VIKSYGYIAVAVTKFSALVLFMCMSMTGQPELKGILGDVDQQ